MSRITHEFRGLPSMLECQNSVRIVAQPKALRIAGLLSAAAFRAAETAIVDYGASCSLRFLDRSNQHATNGDVPAPL